MTLSHTLKRLIGAAMALPLRACRRRRLLRILARSVARLPAPAREIYLLHRRDGLPIQAVADRLGLVPEEVEAHLIDALVRLSRALDDAASWSRRGPPG